jgi:hypothetical protein
LVGIWGGAAEMSSARADVEAKERNSKDGRRCLVMGLGALNIV